MSLGGKREGSGRKKSYATIATQLARDIIAKVAHPHWTAISEKAVEQAKAGDRAAREWLTDQVVGKARQALDITTLGDKIQSVSFATLTNEELERIAGGSQEGISI